MKNRVEVILFVYKNLIFGKVLYTNPCLIGKLYFNKYDDTRISSVNMPELQSSVLFIRGERKDYNNLVFYYPCEDGLIALQYCDDIIYTLKDLNSLSSEELDNYI